MLDGKEFAIKYKALKKSNFISHFPNQIFKYNNIRGPGIPDFLKRFSLHATFRHCLDIEWKISHCENISISYPGRWNIKAISPNLPVSASFNTYPKKASRIREFRYVRKNSPSLGDSSETRNSLEMKMWGLSVRGTKIFRPAYVFDWCKSSKI